MIVDNVENHVTFCYNWRGQRIQKVLVDHTYAIRTFPSASPTLVIVNNISPTSVTIQDVKGYQITINAFTWFSMGPRLDCRNTLAIRRSL